jgi:SAM-dependent methyltransferase
LHENRLRSIPNPILSLEEELEILHQLTEFELGRFLLENGGINGYWTAYWLIHGPKKDLHHPLEKWLIHELPFFQASRERFKIFQQVTQQRLRSNMKLASIPSGLLDDLLGLDYTNMENIELVGIDLDEDSLDLGEKNIQNYHPNAVVSFAKKDAWNLGVTETYDLITSNGLNFYEPDDQKVEKLYQEFYQALRPGGSLITSFLTPPPGSPVPSFWKNFNPRDALKQKAIMVDILQARVSAFRTEETTYRQLQSAGFKNMEFIYDSRNIFPTVVAQK